MPVLQDKAPFSFDLTVFIINDLQGDEEREGGWGRRSRRTVGARRGRGCIGRRESIGSKPLMNALMGCRDWNQTIEGGFFRGALL